MPKNLRFCLFVLVISLAGCAPHYDWRDAKAADGSWTILLPAKPIEQSRPIKLNGMQLEMEMRAAEVDGVTFAVGALKVPVAALAAPTLTAMKDALLSNIEASSQSVKVTSDAQGRSKIIVEAVGLPAGGQGTPRAVFAHFATHGTLLAQAVVIGPQDKIQSEAVETFLASFKLP